MISARIARRVSRIALLASVFATAAMYCIVVRDHPSQDLRVKSIFRDNSVVNIVSCSLPLHTAAQQSLLATKEVSRVYNINEKRRVIPASPWCERKRNNDTAVLFRNYNVPFLNERALRERYSAAPTDLHCRYRELLLPTTNSDRKATGARQPDFNLGDSRKLIFGEPLRSDFVKISCWFIGFQKPLFVDYFAVPQRKEQKTSTTEVNEDDFLWAHKDAHNVLIITLGPISSSELSLKLPQTRSYLESTLGAQQFMGYNRIGKGSLANQIPVIFGSSSDGLERMLRDQSFLDDVPHLWSHYKRRNFLTLFLEEIGVGLNSSLFTQERRLAFRTAPADYYLRPIAAALNRANKLSTFCDRSEHKIGALLNYVRDIFRFNTDRRMFAYTSLEGVSHSSERKAAALDKALQEFFAALKADNLFKKTLLFFVSDDGWSHMSFSQRPIVSEIEKYEANAPVCFLAVSELFARSYPTLTSAIKSNMHRLVTPYDLHVTLLSISNPRPTVDIKMHKGFNLFHELPASRTCDEAFIPLRFCSCLEDEITTRTAWEGAWALAHFSVDYINRMLTDFQDACVSWELRDVEEARTLAGSTPSKMLVRILFTTKPQSRFEVYGRVLNADSARRKQSIDTLRKLDGPVGYCLSNSTNAIWRQFCACRINV